MKKVYLKPKKDLIEKYGDRQGSFYTFYPMNGLWREDVGGNDYLNAIDQLIQQRPESPLSLYIHFPFCIKQCLFCHCMTVISSRKGDHHKFVDYMLRELDLLHRHFKSKGFKPNFKELHFGGGSPSIIPDEDFLRIWEALKPMLQPEDLSECTIEIDPRYGASIERLRFYRSLGIDRISFGVQDFDEEVGKIINRVNPEEMIEALLTDEVRQMFTSINFDLIYGLPQQTPEKFKKTVRTAIRLNPDRLAVYVIGHRPDIYKHQRAFEKYYMADSHESAIMFVDAVNEFIANGYDFIGIDHLAKSTDVLSIAKKDGTLFRNAIGYTPGRSVDIIGLGPSSMGIVGGNYFQNCYTLPTYYDAIDRGELPIIRGFESNLDDLIRREVMFDIVLVERIDKKKITAEFKIENFDKYFRNELKALKEFEQDGLVSMHEEEIRVTDVGRFFQRQICQVFDVYNRQLGYTHSREFDDGKTGLDRKVQMSVASKN
ncbi:oxygen-independent coproporphyrinogen III oxidase [Paracoccaceae bacterium]|nr:oxygen-independent coproporphyrinogen III oxidase [Paracoccaceae bacterium]